MAVTAPSDLRGRLLGMLVAFVAGLVGATLAQREPEPCACRGAAQPALTVLPEVLVVAEPLPAAR
jgi:hypothetical protein